MITITASPKNKLSEISINFATKRIKKGLKQGLYEIGKENVRHLKALIKNPPKTGRFYFKNKKNMADGLHQSSKTGQAPANWTGNLLKSIQYKVSDWSFMEFGVTSDAPYSAILETGSINSSKHNIGARPHVTRTANEKQRDNYNSIQKAVARQLGK